MYSDNMRVCLFCLTPILSTLYWNKRVLKLCRVVTKDYESKHVFFKLRSKSLSIKSKLDQKERTHELFRKEIKTLSFIKNLNTQRKMI